MASSIAAHDVSTLLDRAGQGVQILSLDCFDTLIWRNTHAPSDVFCSLDGFSQRQRMNAESEARQRARAKGRDEVDFPEIYGCLQPGAEPAALASLIQAELDAEASHCFAFKPTVELIRKAKAAGLTVIVVSDTYLNKEQLRALIAGAAGQDVADLIDEVFCSSHYGTPKAGNLFKHVLRALKVQPQSILHLGDNKQADYAAPLALGVRAVHLSQFDEDTEQRLRLEAATSALLHSRGLHDVPVLQPHRAQLAVGRARLADPASALGYGVLGPVFHAFAHWLRREARELAAARQGRVKMLFLMRDGHLPKRAYDAIAGADDPESVEIEISRYTAGAASLTTEEAAVRHMEIWLGHAPEIIVKQCLFTPDEADEILKRTQAKTYPLRLAEEIRKPRVLAKIVARSRAFEQRLVDYVRREAQVQPGDTVMLVDLGYNGTVQNRIEATLQRELGVHVAGRYLLLDEDLPAGLDKRGLIDARHYDSAALSSLGENISAVEQLATSARGSVVDYDASGPVRNETGMKGRQSAVREAVQAACLRYIAEAGSAVVRPSGPADAEAERQAAAAILARLLFLPMPVELEALKSFEHDVNWGSDDALKLFDPEVAAEGLKHWGMFYIKGAKRMFLAAELRGQGMPTSLSLLTQSRFGLNLRYQDFCDRSLTVPILIARGNEVAEQTIEAHPTHEGYFLAGVPIGDCRLGVAVLFGQLGEWVQIESVGFLPLGEFFGKKQDGDFSLTPAVTSFEGMTAMTGGLMQCQDRGAFMMTPPPSRADDTPMVLAVVFRLVEGWAEAGADAATPELTAATA
jgi:FMN phosphatase YigB (HAD superfamily)